MNDFETVRKALKQTWFDESPADYEPYPLEALDRIEAEVERLRAQGGEWQAEVGKWQRQATKEANEVERLRAALADVSDDARVLTERIAWWNAALAEEKV